LQTSPWYVTWGAVCEFSWEVTHPNVFRKPVVLADAWSFIEATLAAPGVIPLVPTGRHQEVAAEVFREIPDLLGNHMFDAYTDP
jgi:predicted nucleic acid-binding protein